MKRNVKSILKRNLPTILSVLGVVGAGAVGVSAAVAQHKVEEDLQNTAPNKQEMLKIYAKHYWPTALIFGATGACIVGSNKMSQKQYKELLGAYTALGAGFAGYREAVIQRFGEEVDQELVEESCCVAVSDNQVNLLNTTVPGKELLFYEPISDKFFRAQERDVILAEYHMNRNYVLKGSIGVDELLYFLGIEPNNAAFKYGWNVESGIYWIDLRHSEAGKTRDGETYYKIDYLFPPEPDYEDMYNEEGTDEYQEPSFVGSC